MASGSSSSRPPSAAAAVRPPTPLPPLLPLATPIKHSSDVWQADLRSLFDHAKDRFGDVSWQVGGVDQGSLDGDDGLEEGRSSPFLNGSENGRRGSSSSERTPERIWGHKAIIYARAPPAFQARYFPPSQLRSPSPLNRSHPNGTSSTAYLSASTVSSLRVPSSVSLASTFSAQSSTSTLRPALDIRVDATPQMFKAELEWLYTGEGMGEVVEWLSNSSGARPGEGGAGEGAARGLFGLGVGLEIPGAPDQEVGRIEGPDEKKLERLRNDLVYMWRSKLFSDVKLVLPLDPSSTNAPPRGAGSSIYGPDHSPNDQNGLDDVTSTSATFTVHKFVLVSRSPYFAQLLLNPGGFRSIDLAKGEIELPTPPFTPASVHFCLGFMYAGTLAFSNRKHDLQTAFQIHRSATYLQMSSLRSEIESRIIHEMCDSLVIDRNVVPSKLTSRRVPRVWRFAAAPDVGAKELEQRCREWVICHWGESWGREVGELGKRERDALVKETLAQLKSNTVVAFYRNLLAVRARTEVELRTVQRGFKQTAWSDNLLGMMLDLEQRMRVALVRTLEKVVEGGDFARLLEGLGFEREVLVKLMEDVAVGVGGPEACKEAPRVYQVLVNSLLLKVNPETSEPALATGSWMRSLVEDTRVQIVGHIRRRWMQIREKSGFQDLEGWALKEIADDIDQPISELLAPPVNDIKNPLRKPPVLSSSVAKPRTSDNASLRSTTLRSGLAGQSGKLKDSDTASVSSRMTTASRASVASRSMLASASTSVSRAIVRTSSEPKTTTPVRKLPVHSSSSIRPQTTTSDAASARSTGSRATITRRASGVDLKAPLRTPPAVPTPPTRPRSSDVASVRSTVSRSGTATPTASRDVKGPARIPPSPALPLGSKSKLSDAASVRSTVSRSSTAPQANGSDTKPPLRRPPALSSSVAGKTRDADVASSLSGTISTSARPLVRATRTSDAASTSSRVSVAPKSSTPAETTPRPRSRSTTSSRAPAPSSSTAAQATLPRVPKLEEPKMSRPPTPPTSPVPPSIPSSPSVTIASPSTLAPPISLSLSGQRQPSESSVAPLPSPFVLSSAPPPSTRPARYNAAAAFEPPRRAPVRQATPVVTFVPHNVSTGESVSSTVGVPLNVGIPCIVNVPGQTKRSRCRAFTRYLGRLVGEKGPWVGLELAEGGVGTFLDTHQDGTYGNVKYFQVGDKDEDWDNDAEIRIRGRRRRKISSTSAGGGDSNTGSTYSSQRNSSDTSLDADHPQVQTKLPPDGRCIFVRPTDVVWVKGASMNPHF